MALMQISVIAAVVRLLLTRWEWEWLTSTLLITAAFAMAQGVALHLQSVTGDLRRTIEEQRIVAGDLRRQIEDQRISIRALMMERARMMHALQPVAPAEPTRAPIDIRLGATFQLPASTLGMGVDSPR